MDVGATVGDYSIVVLYFRLGPAVLDTLSTVLEQTVAPTEVVLVDNGSGDDYLDSSVLPRQVRIHRLADNRGYAGGMNAGFAALTLPVRRTVFLTHEVLLETTCMAHLLGSMQTNGHVLVGPILGRTSDNSTWSAGGRFSRLGATRHSTGSGGEVQWLDGACLMVDSAAFRAVGGFDEDFFLYWEDVDISARLRHRGTIAVVPEARAWQDTSLTPVYFRARNRILYWRKRRRFGFSVLASLEEVARVVKNDLPRGNSTRIHARARGVADGWTGALHLTHREMRED